MHPANRCSTSPTRNVQTNRLVSSKRPNHWRLGSNQLHHMVSTERPNRATAPPMCCGQPATKHTDPDGGIAEASRPPATQSDLAHEQSHTHRMVSPTHRPWCRRSDPTCTAPFRPRQKGSPKRPTVADLVLGLPRTPSHAAPHLAMADLHSQQVVVERTDIVRDKACPSPSKVQAGSVRRRANPSSSGELLDNVRRKGEVLLRRTQRHSGSTHRGCEEKSERAIPLPLRRAAGLEGWRTCLFTPVGRTTNNRSTTHKTRCTKPIPNSGLQSGS